MLGLGNNFVRSSAEESAAISRGFANTYSLSFDGSDDLVDMASGSSIDNIFATGGTISVWMYPDSDGGGSIGRVIDKDSGWISYVHSESSGKLKFKYEQVFTGGGSAPGHWTLASADITIGAWNHLVMTYNGSDVANNPIVYINAVSKTLTESNTPVGTIANDSSANFILGNRTSSTSNRGFDGKMDEVAVWDKVLDADAVTAIYNSGTPIALDADDGNYDNSADLQAWWRFEEGSGTSATDSSTNSNTGTLTNGTAYSSSVPS